MTKRAIVTGGAGFIGCNATARLLAEDWQVLVIDNLSRKGSDQNLEWLQQQGNFDFEQIDLVDAAATERVIQGWGDVDGIVHLAGQVAVTTSLVDPRGDFEANALATLNVLEAVRTSGHRPVVLYSSTNKVYGGLPWVDLAERATRWESTSHPDGLSEDAPLDFHSPYGCSKGAADQYIRDYGRIYGLPTVCLRQSCIMGRRQFGVEDQGWVAWFLIAAMFDREVTVFGDGKQVRDLLWVEDLVDLYLRLMERGPEVGGSIFNVGGGAGQTLSLLELLSMIERLNGKPLTHTFSEPRTGDQRWFVANTAAVTERLGWEPTTGVEQAVTALWEWLQENREAVARTISALQRA